jgi:hypothetical protein
MVSAENTFPDGKCPAVQGICFLVPSFIIIEFSQIVEGARHLGVKSVVTTVDGSGVIDELGFEVTRTRVGDAFVSDELRMELLGFLPKRWLAEVNGPALEKPETYDAPLADWEHTNKGTIHPKAQIEKIEQRVSLFDKLYLEFGASYDGTITRTEYYQAMHQTRRFRC